METNEPTPTVGDVMRYVEANQAHHAAAKDLIEKQNDLIEKQRAWIDGLQQTVTEQRRVIEIQDELIAMYERKRGEGGTLQ